jgi:hypothetical protein
MAATWQKARREVLLSPRWLELQARILRPPQIGDLAFHPNKIKYFLKEGGRVKMESPPSLFHLL